MEDAVCVLHSNGSVNFSMTLIATSKRPKGGQGGALQAPPLQTAVDSAIRFFHVPVLLPLLVSYSQPHAPPFPSRNHSA